MKTESFGFQKGVGWSVDAFPRLDSSQTLVAVFAAPGYFDNPEPIEELFEQYPNSHIIGCSTSGEMLGATLNDESLSVAVVKFESTKMRTVFGSVEHALDSFGATQALSQQLIEDDLKAVFVLSDGLHINGSELVRGFNETLGEGVVVTGGLAGDGDRFERTFVLKDGKPVVGAICAVGFYGDKFSVNSASKGGWDKFGHERVVTRSQGNILYSLLEIALDAGYSSRSAYTHAFRNHFGTSPLEWSREPQFADGKF